jgi:DNA protecting protein DprA
MSAESSLATAILALLRLPGVGPVRANRLLARLDGEDGRPLDTLVGDAAIESLLDESQRRAWPAALDWAHQALTRARATGAETLTIRDAGYPAQLRALLGDGAPPMLFVRGRTDCLTSCGVGFCGSRHASDKGLATATDCADQLARRGVNVISGYAAGVDSAVHKAALAAGGTTTMVLAEGILGFRPKSTIAAEWNAERTVVVSEFAPDAPWSVANAMQRNKTICALSRAVVLIEGGLTGGSMAAGKTCLAMGLPLFAAVYEGMPASAAGNAELIKLGAQRPMRNRALKRANIAPLLASAEQASAKRPPAPEAALAVAR